MNGATWTLLGALAATGVAGSLHCVGMCGPILLGLSRRLPAGRSFVLDAVAYHFGRLWTYALLGLLAGAFGQRLETAWGGQRAFAFALGALVIVNGALLLRRSNTRLERRLAAKISALLGGFTRETRLAGRRGFLARTAVGAVMGLTPCGLVWMALIPAAALGHPLLSAAGMIAFGVGTLPALTSVALLDRILAHRIRKHGRAIAAVALILAGVFLFARAWPSADGEAPACHTEPSAQANRLPSD